MRWRTPKPPERRCGHDDGHREVRPEGGTKPEHALPFAKPRPGGDITNLWGKPTTESWWLAQAEGQMRAIAVLNLEVEGETPSAKAAEIGRIFERIARDQLERPRSFEERDAIAHFWGLIGELAAASTSAENLGFAAKVVCRRATALLTHETEHRAESGKPRRRKKKRSAR
jgi:hypothetical protein